MDRIETEILKLDKASNLPSLDRLQADIWAGIAARLEAQKAGRATVSCQAAIMAFALAGSMAAGTFAAASLSDRPQELSSFSSRAAFAPSTLLLGSHP